MNRKVPTSECPLDWAAPTGIQTGRLLSISGDHETNTIASVANGSTTPDSVIGQAAAFPEEVTDVEVKSADDNNTVKYNLTGNHFGRTAHAADVAFMGTLNGSLLDESSLNVGPNGQSGSDTSTLSAPTSD